MKSDVAAHCPVCSNALQETKPWKSGQNGNLLTDKYCPDKDYHYISISQLRSHNNLNISEEHLIRESFMAKTAKESVIIEYQYDYFEKTSYVHNLWVCIMIENVQKNIKLDIKHLDNFDPTNHNKFIEFFLENIAFL